MTDRDIEAAADSIADFCDRRADRDAASKEIVALVNRAILQERERCAKACEDLGQIYGRLWKNCADLTYGGMEDGANACAAAIREGVK